MTCHHCGAAIGEPGAFCTYCGARVVKDVSTRPTDPARFDLAQNSPGYRHAARHEPHAPAAMKLFVPAVMLVLSIAFLIASHRLLADNQVSIAFKLVFLTAPTLMVVSAIVLIVRAERFARAPVAQEIVVVVDERLAVHGAVERPQTRYYATVQRRDGQRVEYQTYGWLAGRISPSDIGVAYLKGDRLVDFVRLDVG
ncbi:MAG TPA: hypothetical protein VGO00_10025 [Kofleriaceae bacterium]|jgi:hypothetical protein|nr:hypothetical protein [Kofleriaceae bacterium]